MNNRWCIIAGPRSGSRWLEDSIWTYFFNITSFAQRLGEVIHPLAGNKYPPFLNKNNNLYLTEEYKNNHQADNLKLFLKQQTETILKGNIAQPLTMRVFCQTWHYTIEEYLDFFQQIEKHGFNFISLERNVFDRAISWYIMEITGIQHKLVKENSNVYTCWNGKEINILSEKITVDVLRFLELYKLCEIDNKARLDINYILPVKKITYENLIQDCMDNNIPIATNIAIKKLYNESYQDKIHNWDDLVSAVQPFLEKEIYD
jgi:hypothetical protein